MNKTRKTRRNRTKPNHFVPAPGSSLRRAFQTLGCLRLISAVASVK
jgi:hypothetical protein